MRLPKFKKPRDGAPVFMDRDKSAGPLKIIFEEPFCIDKVVIEEKDIVKYINGKSTPLLGDDFYYCYTYEGSVLSFVSFRSAAYQAGAAHLLVRTILNEGRYCVQSLSGAIFYYIENDRQGISVEVDYESREGYDLLDAQTARRDIQDALQSNPTIRAKWSLERRAFSANMALIAIFALIMVAALTVSWKYKSVKSSLEAQKARQTAPKPAAHASGRLPNVASAIAKVGDEISGKGVIETAEVTGKSMKFVISFKTEQAAQSFIRQFGGSYEQGKVIYSAALSGSK